jgi:hypothetical protein
VATDGQKQPLATVSYVADLFNQTGKFRAKYMKSVSAFRLSDRIFVHPNCLTTAGLHIAAPDYLSLPLDAEPEAVGQAVSAAL